MGEVAPVKKRFEWNAQMVKWFHEASKYTEYYSELYSVIGKYIKSTDSVIDLGCGAGNLGFFMSGKVDRFTQLDCNEFVISSIDERIKNERISNMETVLADWTVWKEHGTYDCAVISYSNGAIEYFEELRRISRGFIIIILAESNRVNSFNVKDWIDLPKLRDNRDTIEKIVKHLDLQGINYEYESVECEFGQVFDLREEAFDFMYRYFGNMEGESLIDYVEKNLTVIEDKYYLPHLKKSGVVVIDTSKEEF